jgi:hypothetical protein
MLMYRLTSAVGLALLLASAAACGEMVAPTAPALVGNGTGGAFSGQSLSGVVSGERANTVAICHVTSEETIIAQDGTEALGLVGHVIFVAPAAEAAHCAHGDHTPTPDKVLGDLCQRRIDQPTPNVRCAGEVQLIRPKWATPASF